MEPSSAAGLAAPEPCPAMTAMPGIIAFDNAGVRGFLHRPDGAGDDGVVLTHGAGGNCAAPVLVAAAAACAAAGLWVLRCDLPFRQRRPSGPPSPSGAAADREGLRSAVAAMRGVVPGRVFLGGHSYGGRQASMLAAEEPGVAAALLLLSYPLHPPKKPEQLRTAHFPLLRVPVVFVHGEADPFGSIEALREAVALIPAAAQIIPVAGAGHDLKRARFDAAPAVAALLASAG
jgi:predicted alpha/beta-hydrolase family hydrolase